MMKKESKLFIGLLIGITLSFILCGYSLIRCFVIGYEDDSFLSHILEISYLFIHLIACGLLFYVSFRALKMGSIFIRSLTIKDDESYSPLRQVIFALISLLCLGVAIYSTLQTFGLNLPLNNVFSLVIWHDLMNAFYLLTIIFISFSIYPFFKNKKEFGE